MEGVQRPPALAKSFQLEAIARFGRSSSAGVVSKMPRPVRLALPLLRLRRAVMFREQQAPETLVLTGSPTHSVGPLSS
jgi:hypothetical protein